MVRTKLASAVLAFTALQSGVVAALGLGELNLKSALNQPLQASIPLSDLGDLSAEQILVTLADNNAFENAGVDRSQFLSSLSFVVEVDANGRGRVVITSDSFVVEPYLDFIIEARWPNGRILREYTVLLDLPVFNDAPASRVSAPVRNNSPAVRPTTNAVEPSSSGPVMRNTRPEPVAAEFAATGPADVAPRAKDMQASLPESSAPSSYRVQHQDTMWKLASRFKPSPYVTTQQTMLALLEKNPEAFIANNVNRIKSGYVLALPSEAEVKAVSHRNALQELKRQDEAWRAGSSAGSPSSDSNSTTSSATAPQLTGGSRQAAADTNSTNDAKFSIASAGDSGSADGDSAQLKERLQAAEEEAEKSRLENSAMVQRAQAMEQQIAALKSLVQLKNDQLAALQSGEASTDASAKSEAQMLEQQLSKAEANEAQATSQLAMTGDNEAAEDGASAPESTEASKGAENGVDEQSSDMAEESAAPSTASQADNSTSNTTQQPWYKQRLLWLLGGVLALLALLVLWLKQRANQREQDEDLSDFDNEVTPEITPAAFADIGSEQTDFDLVDEQELSLEGENPEDVFAAVADLDFAEEEQKGRVEDDDQQSAEAVSEEDNKEVSESDITAELQDDGLSENAVQPQMGDAAAEADIYAAYGRYDQAAALLKNAIAQDPDNSELRLKLIDVYLDTHNRSGFEIAYAELEALGDTDAIARVKESMSATEGVSDWLRDTRSSDSSFDSTAGSGVVDTAPADSADGSVEFENIEGADNTNSAAAAKLDDEDIFDFEFDEDTFNEGTKEGPASERDEASLKNDDFNSPGSASEDEFSLDFDAASLNSEPLDIDEVPSDQAVSAEPSAELSADEIAALNESAPEAIVDENTESDAAAVSDSVNNEADQLASLDDDLAALDFDFDDDSTLENVSLEEAAPLADVDGELDFDLDDTFDSSSEENTTSALDELSSSDDLLPEFEGEKDDEEGHGSVNHLLAEADAEADGELSLERSASEFDLATTPDPVGETADLDNSAIASGLDNSVEFELSDSETNEALDAGEEFDLSLEDDSELSFDADLEPSAPEESVQKQESSEADQESLKGESEEHVSEAAEAEQTDALEDGIDLQDIVFDEFDADLNEADNDSFLLDDDDHVSTKLGLAQAYVDMGDNDGAKDILDEVIAEGNEQQKKEALLLLEQL